MIAMFVLRSGGGCERDQFNTEDQFHDIINSFRYYGTAMAPYWRMVYNNSVEALISDLVTDYPLIKDVSFSIYLCVCLSVYLFIYLSIYLSIYLP